MHASVGGKKKTPGNNSLPPPNLPKPPPPTLATLFRYELGQNETLVKIMLYCIPTEYKTHIAFHKRDLFAINQGIFVYLRIDKQWLTTVLEYSCYLLN